jgi:hypothetical protein
VWISAIGWAVRHELVVTPVGSDASDAEAPEATEAAAETEASVAVAVIVDEFEQRLTAAFGPVPRWWVQPDGLRLPLP